MADQLGDLLGYPLVFSRTLGRQATRL